MRKLSTRHHLTIVFLLLVIGGILRLMLFSGFVLGDDAAYADLASRIIQGSYPPIGTHGVFSCRPLVLYPIAFFIYLFGWFEWSFVLIILIASLINIVLVYVGGMLFFNSLAGILSALAYITFPLDAVHATTLTNDILLSTFIWTGGLLFLISFKNYQNKKNLYLSGLSGFITGAAVAVKFNGIIAPALFIGMGLIASWNNLRHGIYKTLCSWLCGWITANGVLCIFLFLLSGNFFAHYFAELRFNLDYNPSGYVASRENLIQFLLMYPRWILTTLREGHQGYTVPPYGYFFLAYILCLPLILLKNFKAIQIPALCALFFLLVMEFAPLKLFPFYVPIHRLPRFLHIAAIPAAITIGISCAVLVKSRVRFMPFIVWTIFSLLIGTSLYWSWNKAYFYKDCALDQRWAWNKIRTIAAKKIITDLELRNYLMFRSGFNPAVPIEYSDKMPVVMAAGSVVIFGGSRRPEMNPFYSLNWVIRRHSKSWQLLGKSPYPLTPWRLSQLEIYRIIDNTETANKQKERFVAEEKNIFRERSVYHEPIMGMKKIAEIDVGNLSSEKEFNYQLTKPTWFGDRNFAYKDGSRCTDDGRAYRGREEITITNLFKNRPLLILKRLDPGVRNQEVLVYFRNERIGVWTFNMASRPFEWQESSFIIPEQWITESYGKLEFHFCKSDSDINSFYYWFFQPE